MKKKSHRECPPKKDVDTSIYDVDEDEQVEQLEQKKNVVVSKRKLTEIEDDINSNPVDRGE